MIEIRNILAPTDFSPHAEKAVRYACLLAERLGATLHLLHVLSDVVPVVGPDPVLTPVLPPEFYTEAEEQAHARLEQKLDPSWGTPAAVTTAVRWGDAVEEIVAYARERESDMIVIATHGRTGLRHVLMGSVAERIVREAPCAVLTIRDPDRG